MKKTISFVVLLLLALAAMPAWADSWVWNYSGNQTNDGTFYPGQDSPQTGGRAICSAPRLGQWMGGYFYWTNECTFPMTYEQLSLSFSDRSDNLQDGIKQVGYLFFFGQTKASYVAEEQCSLISAQTGLPGDPNILYNEGDCNQ